MVRQVVWDDRAVADVEDIRDYVARDSSDRAEKVVSAIRQATAGLVDFPFRNRKIPEFNDHTRRETFVYKYRVMYRVEPTCVRILRVVHGQRLLINVHGSFEEAPQAEYVAGPPEAEASDPSDDLSEEDMERQFAEWLAG